MKIYSDVFYVDSVVDEFLSELIIFNRKLVHKSFDNIYTKLGDYSVCLEINLNLVSRKKLKYFQFNFFKFYTINKFNNIESFERLFYIKIVRNV